MKNVLLKKNAYYLFLLAIAIIGIITLLYSTKWGIGISPDSIVYLKGAESLLHQNSFSLSNISFDPINVSMKPTPITVFPPLFSMFVAISAKLGLEILSGARYLNTLLFGINIFTTGIILLKCTKSYLTSLMGTLLILGSPTLLGIHSMAWTEPLFIFLSVLSTYLLALHLSKPNPLILVSSSIGFALAFLTKYATAALIPSAIISILLYSDKKSKQKLNDIALFTATCCLPIILWILRNIFFAGNATDKTITFNPMTQFHLNKLLSTFSIWILPGRVPGLIGGTIFIVVVFGFFIFCLHYRKNAKNNSDSNRILKIFSGILLINILFSILLLAISILFLDANIPFDQRTLSLTYCFGLILVVCKTHDLYFRSKKQTIKNVLVLLSMAFILLYAVRQIRLAQNLQKDGQEFASIKWRQSETIRDLKTLEQRMIIYTNGPDVINFYTNKPTIVIPEFFNDNTLKTNTNYPKEIKSIKLSSVEHDVVLIVYLNNIFRYNFPTINDLKKELPLQLIAQNDDGVIYKLHTQ